ncbi:unnamed protein product [Rotaria magnacalcarata]|uniref:DNA-directed DNA polymerase n=2 Tax=Rotaria magnacalcarata TaxID=392030 RepID=A0A816WCP8_9BILA|nr:unnamed protein product [Rotaria magnacalcarata]
MATSDSFIMDSMSDSLLAAVTETSFYGAHHPPVAEKPLKPLNELNLPSAVINCYQRFGISHLFAWQAECLEKAGASGKRNFIFSAPASAGKTIVSELLLIKSVLETKRKALFIEPYVSIVQEKANYFRKLFSSLHLRIASYAGSSDSHNAFSNSHIIICTIEKANSIINRLLANRDDLNEIGIIIVDELHWIGETNRGYLLELLLSKVIYYNHLQATMNPVQIIGMSATIPNLNQLAEWLNAEIYETTFRPIPLEQYIKIESMLYNKQFMPVRQLQFSDQWNQGDSEGITEIIWNVIEHNCRSVLVFCSTKHWCEILGKLLAKNFRRIMDDKQINPFDNAKLEDVIEQLRRTPAGLDADLACSIPMGVAFHHAGLTIDEREIIENAYRSNSIRVIVCTSTLSTGVNLPARLVIIRSPLQNGRCIELSTYLQMVGRAGRKGYDDYAESILICSKKEVELVQKMFEQQKTKPVNSCFFEAETHTSVKRALLEVISSGKANTKEQIISYIQSTFFYICSKSNKSIIDEQLTIDKCLQWLCDNELIHCIDKENSASESNLRYEPTQLALAIISSSINPDDGLKLVVELNKAQRSLCLENDLHLVYLVENDLHLVYLIIPQHLINSILTTLDWNVFHTVWPTSAVEQHVAHLVGVTGMVVYKKAASLRIEKREYEEKLDGPRYARFFIALILNDLLSEKSMCDVIRKYECTKSFVQQLQQTTATFTCIVQIFAERLSWNNLKQLLNGFQSRLNFGIKQELCELVRISILNACRARQLYSDGFTTLASLANGDAYEIERSIKKAVPFQTTAQQLADERQGQTRQDRYCIFVPGQSPLTNAQAAREIIEEAKVLLQRDLQAMGFGIVIQKPLNGNKAEEHVSNSDTDSDDEENENESDLSAPRLSSTIQFPCLLDDKNINIRNAYVDGKYICSEFILMIEHKETIAISCFTKKIKKMNSDPSVFHINNQEELYIQYVACAFSIHKVYIIDVAEDEQYFQQHRMSALIHIREKLMNRKHNVVVFNALHTLFTLSSYLAIPRVYARIIDLQICTWLKQDPIEFDRISTWIETHHCVLRFDKSLDAHKDDDHREMACLKIAGEVLLYASIVPRIEQQMNKINLWNYYVNIEMPALNIILQMLLNGVLIDREELINAREDLLTLVNKLELQAYRLVKRRFKMNSQKDLIKILYGELRLPVQRTPHGRICLKKSYLKVLADKHPLPKLIAEYRQVQSALDRCIDRFEQCVNEPNKPQSLQRLRREAAWQAERTYAFCHFLTSTGRMMITNPPLQHVPKRFPIQSLQKESIVGLRKMIVARPGFQLVSFDYSQLELRILAHLSNDDKLKARLITDTDFFISLAADLLKEPEHEITHEQRQNAKQICYGILYGMSNETFARETQMNIIEAEQFVENFYKTFPTMTQYLVDLKRHVLENGYVQSIHGRPLYFDLSHTTSNEMLKARMERQAINFVVQASACDIMKVAMERINQILDRMFPFDLKIRPTPIRPVYLVLQIHDELIFEIENNSRTNEILNIIRHAMEINDHINLSLPVQMKSGDNWESMISIV